MTTTSAASTAAGREAGVVALFEAHHDELLRLAVLLAGDLAAGEELVQEAFVEAWRRWDGIRSTATAGYLRSVIVNLARRTHRRRRLELRGLRAEGRPAPDDPDSRIDLARALALLPPRKRACVVLRYYSDLSPEDTAATLGVSVGTVKSQTAKALRLLARHLDQQGGAGGPG